MTEGFNETGKLFILSNRTGNYYIQSFIHQNSSSFQADQQYLISPIIFSFAEKTSFWAKQSLWYFFKVLHLLLCRISTRYPIHSIISTLHAIFFPFLHCKRSSLLKKKKTQTTGFRDLKRFYSKAPLILKQYHLSKTSLSYRETLTFCSRQQIHPSRKKG